MAKSQYVVGLDIGNSSIKILVAQKIGKEWDVVALSTTPSFGLKRGVIVDEAGIQKISKDLQELLESVHKNYDVKVKSVFVNMGGSHIYTIESDGLISVSRADHVISQEDIDRVLQATKAINIPLNEEVFDVFVREFIIDDQKGIRQPLGLSGVRLEAKVILLCYFQSYFMNLTQAVLQSRIPIDDVVPLQQKEMGVVLIDIGHSTTSLAVFEDGDLIHIEIFPLGSNSITND